MSTPEDLNGRRIHFMGAGGIGVSALMELALARGAIVSGCDCSEGGQVRHLREMGLDIKVGHHPDHISECDELIYTPAVADDHPELVRARALGVRVEPRMSLLGRISRGSRSICVTGSHGKTSLTWMIAHLLIVGGKDPSLLVGGVVPGLGSNVRVGRHAGVRSELVMEVDESDNRLDRVVPSIPIVTNIDNDHMENFNGMEGLRQAMVRFLASTREQHDRESILIGCGDDPRVYSALEEAEGLSGVPFVDYGLDNNRCIQAQNVSLAGMSSYFDVVGPFGNWKRVHLSAPGIHNVLNALGAIALAWRLGLDESAVREGLSTYKRVGRRFEIKGEVGGVRVVDDYGHHPSEVAATVSSAKGSTRGRVGVLFQPHRYSRTKALMDDFAETFVRSDADLVCIIPVYAASEEPIPGADHFTLVERTLAKGHTAAVAASSREEAVALVKQWVRPGDTVLIQGAGDVTDAAGELLDLLAS